MNSQSLAGDETASYNAKHEIPQKNSQVLSVADKDYSELFHFFEQILFFIIKPIQITSQFLSWFILKPVFALFFDIEVRGRENLNRHKGSVIFALNHIGFFDSFIIKIATGLFSRHIPISFLGTLKFEKGYLRLLKKTGVIHFIYALFGVCLVEKGLGLEKNLSRPKQILNSKGGDIAIFPEGSVQCCPDCGIGQFKRGVIVLSNESRAPIIPMVLKIIKKQNSFDYRKKFIVHIDKPHLPNPHKHHDGEALVLEHKFKEIYNNLK